MRRFLISLIFVAMVCFARTSEARKLALLVGVDEYVNVPSLACCVNDMKTLKDALLKIDFEEDDIQVLTTGGKYADFPTKRNIEKKIAKILSEAQPLDTVFIAFSGHGAQEGQTVYFCPPDVEADDLEGTCVSITKIMGDLAECQAKFKLVVVDACRNYPTQSAKGIGGKGLQTVPAPPAGIALFQSCAEGEESWEDGESGNGYFTKNFAAALSGEADSDRDGQLTLMEVCKWTTAQTKKQVMANQNKSQKPYISGSFSDFTLTEDLNVLKAKALAVEAEQAMKAKQYELAIEKFEAALALCPKFKEWSARKRDAKRLLESQKPKFNPMKITVPDDFATIEDAYAKVKDGGVITIKPGKYELSKTLVVNRNVTFRGDTSDPDNVVIECSVWHTFQITGGSPSLQNLTVSNTAEPRGKDGDKDQDGDEAENKDEDKEYPDCLYITGGTPKLFRCIITSRKGSGIGVEGKETNPTVEKCIMKSSGNGVCVRKEGRGEFSDCEIYGNTLPGIGVWDSGNPTFIGCKIHDNKQNGIWVFEKGLGEFTDCEIYGNTLPGIEVRDSGNPTVTGCKIHDGKDCGVLVWQEGRGEFRDCEIYENTGTGIVVKESGNPTVTGCKIHDNKQNGVHVCKEGRGEFRDCNIYTNGDPGIAIHNYGNPTVIGCLIHDGKSNGVSVWENGLGELRDCEIYGNEHPGIGVWESGNPTVTGCKIHDNKQNGIWVKEKGLGEFRDCEIYGNEYTGINVSESGNPTVVRCNIHDGKNGGVWIHDQGMGTFNYNTLKDNYTDGNLENWDIRSDAGVVKGYNNTPEMPAH